MNKKRIIILSIVALVLAAVIVALAIIIPTVKRRREAEKFAQAMNDYYNAKVAQYEEENTEKYGVDVAFIGDSLTDGYDLNKYYTEFTVANRGIGGDTTWGVEKRLKVSLYDINPRVVVMMIGTNNWYDMFDNYERILKDIKKNLPESKIVLMSIPPVGPHYNDRNHHYAFNNVKIKILAEKYSYTYVDIHSKLIDINTEMLRSEYTTDDLHFTPLGYEVITSTLKPVLLHLLGKS